MNKLLSKREVAETLSFSMRKFLAFFERLYLSFVYYYFYKN
jgi:hypothetical protein